VTYHQQIPQNIHSIQLLILHDQVGTAKQEDSETLLTKLLEAQATMMTVQGDILTTEGLT
jgi:cell shape-determining protein MreC